VLCVVNRNSAIKHCELQIHIYVYVYLDEQCALANTRKAFTIRPVPSSIANW
jgi:hypothetical protein